MGKIILDACDFCKRPIMIGESFLNFKNTETGEERDCCEECFDKSLSQKEK